MQMLIKLCDKMNWVSFWFCLSGFLDCISNFITRNERVRLQVILLEWFLNPSNIFCTPFFGCLVVGRMRGTWESCCFRYRKWVHGLSIELQAVILLAINLNWPTLTIQEETAIWKKFDFHLIVMSGFLSRKKCDQG